MSSREQAVNGNAFSGSYCDTLWFGDVSDNHVVRNNSFIDAWECSPVSDWSYNIDRHGDGTKVSGECTSPNNLVQGNVVI